MLQQMYGRVRQFVRAVTQHMGEADHAFVRANLPAKAWPLFYAMHPADQVHARNVAYTARALAGERGLPEEQRTFLIRCALLHDVGRRRGDLDILGKVFAVLMMHYLPHASERLMEHEGRLGHALYVYRHHPAIGAALLREIGMAEEARIIERHHMADDMADAAGDRQVLRLLREADARN